MSLLYMASPVDKNNNNCCKQVYSNNFIFSLDVVDAIGDISIGKTLVEKVLGDNNRLVSSMEVIISEPASLDEL